MSAPILEKAKTKGGENRAENESGLPERSQKMRRKHNRKKRNAP
jgi:hypothetical protein